MRVQLPAYSPLTARAILSGWYSHLTENDNSHALADDIASRLGVREVLLTDSATTALALAIRGAAEVLGKNSRIALPAFGCFDLATAAISAGARVRLYDVQETSLGPDFRSFERIATRELSAAVLAHQYGFPVDVSAARTMLDGSDVLLIEDAAQGNGALLNGIPAGALAPIGILSFGRGKGITGGRGGALVSTNAIGDAVVGWARRHIGAPKGNFADLAVVSATWLLGRPWLYGIPSSIPFLHLGQTRFRPPHPPSRMPPAAVSILRATLPLAGAELHSRQANARYFVERLPAAASAPVVISGGCSGYLRLPVRVSGGQWTNAGGASARRLGIARAYPASLSRLGEFLKHIEPANIAFPQAERLTRALITIPVHSKVRGADRDEILRWLESSPPAASGT